ncbi:MAG: SUMF1/EgtB/PvdO family nonheme iron enzyme, partial [Rhodospirillales bacterium]|nr:SUMF1/EgtB/PvdO family nonheme iron enzyme [Rhodospirillales bacterium]
MSQKSIPQRVFASFRIRRDLLGVGLSILVFACACAFAPGLAFAAQWPAEYYNPSPADDDIVLAMPCGGAMTFRKIAIPNEGPLNDYPIMVGGTDDGRGFAENIHPAYIAGSFGENGAERYYLLGKYEVNRLQYAAINESCLKPELSLRLPQVNVSWFDAVNGADRYSRWLRTNAADSLPKDGKESGFVRLPTEVEWEFAARGGTAVSPADFRERVFPTPEGLARYVWSASTESSNRTLQFGGLLKPNPLGLHDILGNVDEIVLEPFRLNRLDRLHGQAG